MPEGTVDFSVTMFDAILGRGWEHYLYPTAQIGEDSPASALAAMYMIENSVMLAMAGIVFVYMIFMGVIGTAHEGTPLGKKYSTLWTPFRGVVGAAFLMPLPWTGGFSLFQALLLKFTHIAIIAANLVMAGPRAKARLGARYRGTGQVEHPIPRFSLRHGLFSCLPPFFHFYFCMKNDRRTLRMALGFGGAFSKNRRVFRAIYICDRLRPRDLVLCLFELLSGNARVVPRT